MYEQKTLNGKTKIVESSKSLERLFRLTQKPPVSMAQSSTGLGSLKIRRIFTFLFFIFKQHANNAHTETLSYNYEDLFKLISRIRVWRKCFILHRRILFRLFLAKHVC